MIFTAHVGLLGASLACSGHSAPAPVIIPPGTTPVVASTYTIVSTAGKPFQAAVSSDGTVFVSVNADGTSGSATGVQVFRPVNGALQPSCVVALPGSLLGANTDFANLSFFSGGTDLGGGIGFPGAIFYHAFDPVACNASGFVVGEGSTTSNDEGTLAVVLTPDGKFAFVLNESGVAPGASTQGNVGVVAIQRDSSGDFTTGTALIGQIPTGGNTLAGITMSPDGTRLYVTSEVAAPGTLAAGGSNPILSNSGCVLAGNTTMNGLLTVIDVSHAESSPGPGAILATIDAGCSPVRMSETSDGTTLWVAVRGDNRVLAFSTTQLESNPDHALLGFADTGGTAPVGIRLFHNDRFLAVANSNRFQNGSANATILNVASPVSAAVVEIIPTGQFPREITVGPDDATLYLTNFNSDTLEIIKNTFP